MQITIDPNKLSQIKLWILVPAAGDKIHATFSSCLIKLLGVLRQHGVWYELRYLPGDSLVTRARNNLASTFMSASTDDNLHLSLWLDCDILFEPESVLQMLALDRDFIAAPYSKKGFHVDRMRAAIELGWDNDKIMRVVGTPNVNWLVNPVSIVDPHPVLESGSGFWLVKRKVFRMIEEAYGEDYQDGKYYLPGIKFKRNPEEAHYGEIGYDYFGVGVWWETREYLSEDWWMCRTWRKLGGTVLECFWVKTHHIGPHAFPMDMPVITELLNATGGYINGPTKETKPQVGADIRGDGRDGGTGEINNGKSGGSGRGSDITRALAFVLHQTLEATVPRHPSAVGGGIGVKGSLRGTLPRPSDRPSADFTRTDEVKLHSGGDDSK